MPVTFSYADRLLNLPAKTKLKAFITSLFTSEGKSVGSLNYVFCSDDYLLDINQKFLQHDYYTDIITFDLSEPDDEAISGEVYVSVDRIKDNATVTKSEFADEALRVIFHGALHLCGYLDKKKSEIALMRDKEEQYLRLYSNL
jgi:probable rRNA maturation factor